MSENKQVTVGNVAFTRSDTKAIKGIAIVLMLFHHLAAFPTRFPVGFAGFQSWIPGFEEGECLKAIAQGAKLCVPMFFFLGGYGLYIRWSAGKFSVKDSILNLYKIFWKVFVVFIPIAFLFFARTGDDINALCTRYVVTDVRGVISNIITNFVGWKESLNSEWWFLGSYICALPLGYLFCHAIKKNCNFWVDLFIVFGIDILIATVFPAIVKTEAFASLGGNAFYSRFLTINSSASALFAGIVFAKYDGICEIKKMIKSIPWGTVLSFIGVCAIGWCRSFVVAGSMEIIFCILAVPMLSVIFDKIKLVKKIFGILGKHSTNMWLIHGFYVYYFLEITHIVYSTRIVWVDLLILLELCLTSSILLNGFWFGLGRLGKTIGEKYTTYQLKESRKEVAEKPVASKEETAEIATIVTKEDGTCTATGETGAAREAAATEI